MSKYKDGEREKEQKLLHLRKRKLMKDKRSSHYFTKNGQLRARK